MLTVPELLAFENRYPRHTSRKEAAIVEDIGVKPARYYQMLQRAVRTTEALHCDPMLCRRVLGSRGVG